MCTESSDILTRSTRSSPLSRLKVAASQTGPFSTLESQAPPTLCCKPRSKAIHCCHVEYNGGGAAEKAAVGISREHGDLSHRKEGCIMDWPGVACTSYKLILDLHDMIHTLRASHDLSTRVSMTILCAFLLRFWSLSNCLVTFLYLGWQLHRGCPRTTSG